MFEGLLPIGTVVLLNGSTKRVMIVGVVQKGGSNPDNIWDYTGVIFPEGYIDSEKMVLFNNEQIAQIFSLGYQDTEQMEFKKKADELINSLR